MEQNDYRRGSKPNVFFGLEKRYFGIKFGVFTFDTVVLIVIHPGIACPAALDFAKTTGGPTKLAALSLTPRFNAA